MDRAERNGADWLIPAARVKVKREFLLPVSEAALKVLGALPVLGEEGAGPVFTTDGERPIAAKPDRKNPISSIVQAACRGFLFRVVSPSPTRHTTKFDGGCVNSEF